MHIRPAVPSDFDAVLTLNEKSVHFLSALDRPRLEALHAEAALHAVLEINGSVAAFVLALREGTAYENVNYRWFSARYERFLYVDRIVVDGHLQGRGAGKLLYSHVFAYARQSEVLYVTCEFDIDPPNSASERFHGKFGFREVGRQYVQGGKKQVSLQVAAVSTDPESRLQATL